jgi:hypothetical protein
MPEKTHTFVFYNVLRVVGGPTHPRSIENTASRNHCFKFRSVSLPGLSGAS